MFPVMAVEDRVHLEVIDLATWHAWLDANHARADGVWVVTYKKGSGTRSPPYDALVEEGLCFGWVDSRPGKVDALRTKLYFAPRKRGSAWAATNKARVARLLAEGRMQPAGLAAIDAAKADGSWSRIDGSEAAVVPDDLRAALDATPPAGTHFDAFPRGVRKGILQWIEQAKTPATRAKRVAETVAKAAQNERANQWVPKEKR